jgi:hypothetical protein
MSLGEPAGASLGECASGIGCERAPSGLSRWFGSHPPRSQV